MSCPDSTAPINIVPSLAGTCDLKCEFQQSYTTTSISAENRDTFIRFSFDADSVPPVQFNSEKYNVMDMRLYQPSLHRYGGIRLPGEIIIRHSNVSQNEGLFVCVPITEGGSSSDVMDSLISQVGARANSSSGRTAISLQGFSLANLVPNAPYYNYQGTQPFIPCIGLYQYVVFGQADAIKISSANALLLKNIIKSNEYESKTAPAGYFFNKKGPTQPTEGDDIYIDCKPTGSEGKTLVSEASSTATVIDLKTILASPVVKGLFGAIVMLLLLKLFTILFTLISGKKSIVPVNKPVLTKSTT